MSTYNVATRTRKTSSKMSDGISDWYKLSLPVCTDADTTDWVKKGHKVTVSTATMGYARETRMLANAQRDGRPAEHRWRPLFNAAKFG